MPIAATTFQCPLLETVTIQCSKDDDKDEINKIVSAMVANGSSLEKIQVTFYEDIREKELAERRLAGQEKETARGKLEKILKKRREWVDDFIDYGTEDEADAEMEDDYDSDDW
jgi:hypothetical protein